MVYHVNECSDSELGNSVCVCVCNLCLSMHLNLTMHQPDQWLAKRDRDGKDLMSIFPEEH